MGLVHSGESAHQAYDFRPVRFSNSLSHDWWRHTLAARLECPLRMVYIYGSCLVSQHYRRSETDCACWTHTHTRGGYVSENLHSKHRIIISVIQQASLSQSVGELFSLSVGLIFGLFLCIQYPTMPSFCFSISINPPTQSNRGNRRSSEIQGTALGKCLQAWPVHIGPGLRV